MFSLFPHLFAMEWWYQMPWSLFFGMLSFKPAFSLSSFTFIKKFFSSSLLSSIRVVSFMYQRLLIFLPAILIPACESSSPAFHIMYSVYKLNKQGDKRTALTYSFPNVESVSCSMSDSNSCFLSCKQVSQEAGNVVWYSHLFKNISQFVVIHAVKGFSVVSEAEVDIFGIPLLFLWSSICWQFDLCFLCLF